MSPFLMILLILLVVYFVSKKKQTSPGQGRAKEPPREPLQVTGEEGCWSCTPEELLDELSHTVLQTGSRALPVYVYGQGYEVRDLRHWVTMLTEPGGRLAEVVVTWCPDGDPAIRQAAAYYAGTLLSLLSGGDSEAMIRELNGVISRHKTGQRDELVKHSPLSRVSVLVADEPSRQVTIRLTPELGAEPVPDPEQTGVQAESDPVGNDPAGEAEDTKE